MIGRALPRAAVALVILFAAVGMSRTPPGSEDYRDGYLQGCWEGYSAAGWKGYDYHLDRTRLAASPDYRKGRDDGLRTCYEEAANHPARDIGPGGGGR